MNEIANQLVQSLFKKNSVQDCSRWELEILADHYPYFGIAQLLVARKLKEENAEGYEKQVQKTSLYFTNPFWLDYVLNQKTLPDSPTIPEEKIITNPIPEAILEHISEVETGISHSGNHNGQSGASETIVDYLDAEETAEESLIASPEETTIVEPAEEKTDINPVPEAILEKINQAETEIIHGENLNGHSGVTETVVDYLDSKENTEESLITSAEEIALFEQTEEITDTNPVPEAILEKINEVEAEVIHEENDTVQSEVTETTVEHSTFNEEVVAEEPLIAAPQNETIVSEEQKEVEFKIAPLKMEPVPDENTPLAFEPYHTVDYFASQGIKLSVDEKPQDRFGQQLKSFTQWLKTIKKMPPAEIVNESGKGTEQKIVSLAEHSIEDREIVTETMAEVWAKQGNREKAIEVYNKLSLQNPAKSSYFASLIEQLNQH